MEFLLKKYTSKMLDDIIREIEPNVKGLYKLRKSDKIKILMDIDIDESELPPIPERTRVNQQYGVKGGKVIPYNKTDQEEFEKEGYNDVHPLHSKKLDAKKHKYQYEEIEKKRKTEIH